MNIQLWEIFKTVVMAIIIRPKVSAVLPNVVSIRYCAVRVISMARKMSKRARRFLARRYLFSTPILFIILIIEED